MNSGQAFVTGYQLAKRKRRDFSKRELSEMFPRLPIEQVDAMACGIGDALAGDDWRYKHFQQEQCQPKSIKTKPSAIQITGLPNG